MRFWPKRRPRPPEPSHEAIEALRQARRELQDAEALDSAAEIVERRLQETKDRNHFAEAVIRSMRRTA